MGSAMLESLTDWIAGEEREPGIRPGDIQGQFNRQREDVRGKADDAGFEGAFHPQEVLKQDEFEKDDVATLRTKVDAIDLTAVGNLITAWQAVGDRARASLDTFTAAITRLTEDGVWRGASSDAAVAGVRDYTSHGAQLPNAAVLTSNKLADSKQDWSRRSCWFRTHRRIGPLPTTRVRGSRVAAGAATRKRRTPRKPRRFGC